MCVYIQMHTGVIGASKWDTPGGRRLSIKLTRTHFEQLREGKSIVGSQLHGATADSTPSTSGQGSRYSQQLVMYCQVSVCFVVMNFVFSI